MMKTVTPGGSRLVARCLLLAVVVLAVGCGGCQKDERPPISVSGSVVTVHNLTSTEWKSVEVWLNYHYRVTKPSMLPNERLGIPLDVFVAGYGQRFDVKRAAVKTIQVVAKTASGEPVDVMFGTGPRR
jgi:hypothetical protein